MVFGIRGGSSSTIDRGSEQVHSKSKEPSNSGLLSKLIPFKGESLRRLKLFAKDNRSSSANSRVCLVSKATATNARLARTVVLSSTVSELESLGAGELTRLAKIMNSETKSSKILVGKYKAMAAKPFGVLKLSKIALQQESEIESKIQTAFSRAYTSKEQCLGSKILDKLLIHKHSELSDGNTPLTAEEGDAAYEFLLSNNGKDLNGLSLSEISYISKMLKESIPTGLPSYSAAMGPDLIDATKSALALSLEVSPPINDMKIRDNKSRHTPLEISSSDINHATTLFVELHTAFNLILDRQGPNDPSISRFKNELHTLFISSANNHVQPSELKGHIKELIENSNLSDGITDLILQKIEADMSRFKPTNNLGRQIESPHAKKMENLFAAMALTKPPKAMQDVGRKMAKQLLTHAPEYFEIVLKDYVALNSHYVYPVANVSSMSKKEVRGHIEDGTNLAVVMDFNYYISERFSNQAADNNDVGYELAYTEHTKTYAEDVTLLRGDRVPMPRLKAKDSQQSAIGVGPDTSAITLKNMKTPVIRPSTIKVAFGTHAQESAKVDVAQACGITGRGNVQIWGQAFINQWAVPETRMTENDTRIFLGMLAAVMTADGGHTLSETLGTTHIAARNSGDMSAPAQSKVSDLFHHMKNITEPMDQEATRFRHHDMIFNPIQDTELHQYLSSAWDQTMGK